MQLLALCVIDRWLLSIQQQIYHLESRQYINYTETGGMGTQGQQPLTATWIVFRVRYLFSRKRSLASKDHDNI